MSHLMSHLAILPILVPLLTGILLLLPIFGTSIARQRVTSFAGHLALLAVAVSLFLQSHAQVQTYVLGNWQAPFGIVLVADRLASVLVLLTCVLGFGTWLYALAGDDKQGSYFHPLFMFQLMGINGAFLTGDIFNLFVFFEVLLIASYALLLHGGGKQRTQASVHYVSLNLLGSAFFLFALGILYGTLGSLNMADMTTKISMLTPEARILTEAGALLLLLVFGFKSAMLPLHFWLPRTYSSASASVAALFAIMTKVGIYAIFRVHTGVFGAGAGELAFVAIPWIWPLAILTVVVGAIGVLAAPALRVMVANLVLISAGTLLLAIVLLNQESAVAGIYYLVHTTLVTGALFLLADMIAKQRGAATDRFVVSRPMAQGSILGALFFFAAIIVIGLPPLSGFVGKALLLKSAQTTAEMGWVWTTILLSSLATLIAVSRAGTNLFWHLSGRRPGKATAAPIQIVAVVFLLLGSPLMVVFGGAITNFADGTVEQFQSVGAALSSVPAEGGLPQ